MKVKIAVLLGVLGGVFFTDYALANEKTECGKVLTGGQVDQLWQEMKNFETVYSEMQLPKDDMLGLKTYSHFLVQVGFLCGQNPRMPISEVIVAALKSSGVAPKAK